jgi:hypothetical protein
MIIDKLQLKDGFVIREFYRKPRFYGIGLGKFEV